MRLTQREAEANGPAMTERQHYCLVPQLLQEPGTFGNYPTRHWSQFLCCTRYVTVKMDVAIV